MAIQTAVIEKHLCFLEKQVDLFYQDTLANPPAPKKSDNTNNIKVISREFQKTYELFSKYISLKVAGYQQTLSSQQLKNSAEKISAKGLNSVLSQFISQLSIFQAMFRSAEYLEKDIKIVFEQGVWSMQQTMATIDEIERFIQITNQQIN